VKRGEWKVKSWEMLGLYLRYLFLAIRGRRFCSYFKAISSQALGIILDLHSSNFFLAIAGIISYIVAASSQHPWNVYIEAPYPEHPYGFCRGGMVIGRSNAG
jgi:hypothetical protein